MPNWAYSWPLPLAFLFLWVLLRRKMLRPALPVPAPVAVIKDKGVTVGSASTGILSQEIRVTIILLETNRGGRRGDRDAPIGTLEMRGAIRLSSDLGSDTGATSIRSADQQDRGTVVAGAGVVAKDMRS
ncbi:hypothetical protein EDB83DRAFT_2552095 [Lactarius deliciosus]|nr:hypothetical protein EDB83DRAFT_2552095 [Lactarius deliciosus]